MKFEISFPDQPADEAGVLAQELRLALLRNGADPSEVEIVKERADAMDLGSVVHFCVDAYYASRPIFENVIPALTAVECVRLVYEVIAPAHSGILVKTPQKTYKLSSSETTIERLKQIFDTLDSDEHRD